jgi:MoCo/4Fe-4S cofactor protein with predicted Tat translocation signal
MNERHDVEALRARLEGTRGREYWRSLEALSDTPEFKEFLHREFPQNASEWLDPVGRRGFLKLMGASLALAGVSACTRQPTEELVPYVRQPEELVPGKPLFYATAMPFAGAGTGLLVESHEGARRRSRAIRITQSAAARPTCSLRQRSSASTIPIGRGRSPISARSVRSPPSSRR